MPSIRLSWSVCSFYKTRLFPKDEGMYWALETILLCMPCVYESNSHLCQTSQCNFCCLISWGSCVWILAFFMVSLSHPGEGGLNTLHSSGPNIEAASAFNSAKTFVLMHRFCYQVILKSDKYSTLYSSLKIAFLPHSKYQTTVYTHSSAM